MDSGITISSSKPTTFSTPNNKKRKLNSTEKKTTTVVQETVITDCSIRRNLGCSDLAAYFSDKKDKK